MMLKSIVLALLPLVLAMAATIQPSCNSLPACCNGAHADEAFIEGTNGCGHSHTLRDAILTGVGVAGYGYQQGYTQVCCADLYACSESVEQQLLCRVAVVQSGLDNRPGEVGFGCVELYDQ
jgi:hypothetical protein